jgi:regulator of sigma E protease
MLAILLVVLIFGLLVFVHELGHFVAARRAGIAVEEFGFGFPPRLAGWKRGGTIYSVNLLPLGGFVRLKGEDSADKSAGSFGAAAFADKVKVLLAGVGMNLATAYVVLLGLCWTGLPPMIEGQFSFGNPREVQPRQLLAAEVAPESPASYAGIKKGDIILSGNGSNFVREQDLLDFTKSHAGQEVQLTVKQGSEQRQINVRLRGEEDGKNHGYLGLTPFQTNKLGYGWEAPIVAAGLLVQLVAATFVGVLVFLANVPSLLFGLITQAPMADTATATGPVGLVVIITNLLHLGLSYIAMFVAAISVSLAVFNVLPIPAVDGGRLALVVFQRFTGRTLNPAREAIIHTTGFILLVLLMVVVTMLDIRRVL